MGLLQRGTSKAFPKEEVPKDANILTGRFILTIKFILDGKTNYKAVYVIGGHKEKLKSRMVHVSATVQPLSIRLLLALSAIFGFKIWTADVM